MGYKPRKEEYPAGYSDGKPHENGSTDVEIDVLQNGHSRPLSMPEKETQVQDMA